MLITLSRVALLLYFYLCPGLHLCHRFYCVVFCFMFENNANETYSVQSKSLHSRVNPLCIKNKQMKSDG